MEERIFTIGEQQGGERMDRALSGLMGDCSRSYLQKLIREGHVLLNGQPAKVNARLCPGDLVAVTVPEAQEVEIRPEPIPLDILYEDGDLLVVNKPKGMVVHPGAGHSGATLVNGLLFHCKGQLSGINGELRPGIVHRIDRDTTGTLIVCKNDFAHRHISDQLKAHTITRRYRGIVHGRVREDRGEINAPIGRNEKDRKKMAVNHRVGKEAITCYEVLEYLKGYTYMEFRLKTGRTHQIRVHMSSTGHPLLGDTVYGSRNGPGSLEGQTLHAMVIGFLHPRRETYMEFTAPLPQYFCSLLERLR